MRIATSILFALIPALTQGAELNRTHLIGNVKAGRGVAWNGHIENASWLDDETIVYSCKRGEVTCWSLAKKKAIWSLQNLHNICDWSVCKNKGRLAIIYQERPSEFSDYHVRVVDCAGGKTIFDADATTLAMLTGTDFLSPTRIALMPTDAKLVLCDLESTFGRNGYVIGLGYNKVESKFHIDASPSELSVSSDGSRVTTVADTDVVCIRDIRNDEEVYFQGNRIWARSDSRILSVDGPFASHARHDGVDKLIFTIDNSWSTGRVHIYDLKTSEQTSFDARNGHIEIDVDFTRKRIALTGTSTDLSVLKFDGSVLAHMPNATLQRNVCVAFSPSGKQLLVGSWDNTVSVFEIGE